MNITEKTKDMSNREQDILAALDEVLPGVDMLDQGLHRLPINHSSFFAPKRESTLRTSVEAMTIGALPFLG